MTSGMTVSPSAPRIRVVSRTEVSGSCSIAAHGGAHPHRDGRDQRQPGQVGQGDPAGRAEEDRREGGPAAEGDERGRVGDRLAEQQEEQRPHE